MPEHIKQIAIRIKELREISGIPVDVLASELGISTDLYLMYESGETDIPITFLFAVANKFNVELTAILTGDEPRLRVYSLVRNGKAPSANRRKDYKYQSLAYNFIQKKAEPFLVTVNPDFSNKPIPLNAHPGQEFNYVLEGTLKILIGNNELILNEGDSLYFDSSYKHGMQALNNKPAKFLTVIV